MKFTERTDASVNLHIFFQKIENFEDWFTNMTRSNAASMGKIFKMKIHIVIHESFEGPAAIEDWALAKNHEVSYSRIYAGEKLPKDTLEFDFLIVMGGPQNPDTTVEECSYFNAAAEIELIRNAIHKKKLILGVCLGAQLVGEAYGAKFEHSPHKEIGVFPVTLTNAVKDDPIFSTFPATFLVGHWHGDMPGMLADTKLLATSEGCPRQIVAYESGVYGFQCHFEFTPAAIEALIKNSQLELESLLGNPFIQNIEQLRKNDYMTINHLLFSFLDQMENIHALRNS